MSACVSAVPNSALLRRGYADDGSHQKGNDAACMYGVPNFPKGRALDKDHIAGDESRALRRCSAATSSVKNRAQSSGRPAT